MEDVKPKKMNQFLEGGLGRFENHEDGIPVYSNAAQIPDFGWAAGDAGASSVFILRYGIFRLESASFFLPIACSLLSPETYMQDTQ
jgi:hypothetical protein